MLNIKAKKKGGNEPIKKCTRNYAFQVFQAPEHIVSGKSDAGAWRKVHQLTSPLVL